MSILLYFSCSSIQVLKNHIILQFRRYKNLVVKGSVLKKHDEAFKGTYTAQGQNGHEQTLGPLDKKELPILFNKFTL